MCSQCQKLFPGSCPIDIAKALTFLPIGRISFLIHSICLQASSDEKYRFNNRYKMERIALRL